MKTGIGGLRMCGGCNPAPTPFLIEKRYPQNIILAILGLQPSFPDRMFEKSGQERLQTPPFFRTFLDPHMQRGML